MDVHRNLNKGGWSVLGHGDHVTHRHYVLMVNVRWIVQPGGQSRARREGQRNVHAFARGTIVTAYHGSLPNEQDLSGLVEVTYNPFQNDTFVYADTGKPVFASDWAVFTRVDGKDKVFVQRTE